MLSWSQLNSLVGQPTLQALREDLEEIGTAGAGAQPLCRAVRRGDLLAEKIPATPGRPGRDVEGREIEQEEGEDVSLEAGENISLTEDEMRCTAAMFGYICMRLGQINVVPPLWIAPDRTGVYFVNLPQGDIPVYPRLEDMEELLEQAGVEHGFDVGRWPKISAALEAGEQRDFLILVAQATPMQPGRDAKFRWAVDIETERAGKILEDGSIDFRERNLITAVKEGDLLGEIYPIQAGTSGMDVLGNEIHPPQPSHIEVLTDTRVYAAETGEGTGYYAEISGGVTQQLEYRRGRYRNQRRLRIGVSPISNIAGDVDYSTGNIDFTGDVVIGGSVQSLFVVRASGSVSVGGYVESGSSISAGGDIVIKGVGVGAATTLVAGGSMMAKFIQEATVRTGGDVQIGAYIFNASVRSQGKVEVVGKGEGKTRALVEGLIWAGKGIVARSIGSPYNPGTRLVTGVDPEQVNRLEQLHSNMKSCEERQRQLMLQLGLAQLDIELLKRRLKHAPTPQKKREILMGIKKIARLAELQRDLEGELEEITGAQHQQARDAAVEIQSTLFAGVEIRIGEAVMVTHEDRERVRFSLVEEDDRSTIQMDPLS